MSTSSPRGPYPWETANPFVSGLLAWLIPGAGHFYQGRIVKGIIYIVCIWGLYFGGLRMGEGQVVYQKPKSQANGSRISLSLAAQLGVGFPTVLAFIQTKRYSSDENRPVGYLEQPLKTDFEGVLLGKGPGHTDGAGHLVGTIELASSDIGVIWETRGKFVGTLDGKPIELPLSGSLELERPIAGGLRRQLRISVAPSPSEHPHLQQSIRGSIPRSFVDGFLAPPDPESLRELNFRLAKTYDLALVFTWIAGLLNILAIWDCVQGPAYGIGDEDETPSEAPAGTPPPPPPAPLEPTSPAPQESR